MLILLGNVGRILVNIGLLIPSTKGGGAEKFVDRLAKELSEYHEIYVINYHDLSFDDESNYNRLFLGITNQNIILKQILRINKLRKIKKKYKIDVCISFLENPNIINILSKTKNCKTILSVRNYKSKQLKGIKGDIYRYLIRFFYNFSDLIITNANKSKEDLINNFGVKKDKIKIIYNFYNVQEIVNLATEPIENNLLSLFQKKVIISFGRLEKVKGFKELINAYNYSTLDKDLVKLVILGDGSQKNELEILVSQLGLKNSVFLIGHKENPYKYIKNSKIFVLNSYFEGFPNALVESMICGVPVISTNCLSGPSEIIGKGDYVLSNNKYGLDKYGLLIPTPDSVNSQNALSNALELFISNEDLADKYSKLSNEGIRKLDKTQIIQEWLEVLEINENIDNKLGGIHK